MKLNFNKKNEMAMIAAISKDMPKPVYQDEYITQYLGDTNEILFQLPFYFAHAVITDPPYEMGAKIMSWQQSIEGRNVIEDIHDNDFGKAFDYNLLEVMMSKLVNPNMLFFCNSEQLGDYIKFQKEKDLYLRVLTWHKKGTFPVSNTFLFDTEYVAYMFKSVGTNKKSAIPTYFIESVVRKDQYTNHPTPKPESIMIALVNQITDEDDIVIEPFSGSGTTAVACKKLGRRCIAIDMNETYVKMSIERYKITEANVKQTDLFQFGMGT
jgi:site-specific DNA-methyltransferase (adenine-specific)